MTPLQAEALRQAEECIMLAWGLLVWLILGPDMRRRD